MNIHEEIYGDLLHGNVERLRFTRRAFELLPHKRHPRILDVGCGSGDPTLELARLTDGLIIGIDIDQSALDKLSKRARAQGLADRIQTVNRSMLEMWFPEASFDVIWAEGSIHTIGFETGLDELRRFLKPRGYLVVHEMAWLRPDPPKGLVDRWKPVFSGIRTVPEYVVEIPRHGYLLTGHFALPAGFWWDHYYGPLETRVAELREKRGGDRDRTQQLERAQQEVDLFKKHPGWYGSAFFVMEKT